MADDTRLSFATAPPPDAAPRAPTVLMVEDEILIRMPIGDFLRGCGYRVLEASTGDEAQQLLLSGEAPDVLFSDISMPGMVGGFELAEWVRERFPQMKIILTSGGAHLNKNLADFGRAHAFLFKPYSPRLLAQTIQDLLQAQAAGVPT